MRCLLDVNVLVALVLPRHPFHPRVHNWFRQSQDRLWATCPLTQAGFLRIGTKFLGGSREDLQSAYTHLEHDCRGETHEFWPMDIDLAELDPTLRPRIIGPNQIADLQLLLLAHKHRGQFVTLNKGLHELARGTKYANSLTVL